MSYDRARTHRTFAWINVYTMQFQGVGEGSTLRNVIVDVDASIGPGSFITNGHHVQECDRHEEGYMIQDGIVVVVRNAQLPPGTRI